MTCIVRVVCVVYYVWCGVVVLWYGVYIGMRDVVYDMGYIMWYVV